MCCGTYACISTEHLAASFFESVLDPAMPCVTRTQCAAPCTAHVNIENNGAGPTTSQINCLTTVPTLPPPAGNDTLATRYRVGLMLAMFAWRFFVCDALKALLRAFVSPLGSAK